MIVESAEHTVQSRSRHAGMLVKVDLVSQSQLEVNSSENSACCCTCLQTVGKITYGFY